MAPCLAVTCGFGLVFNVVRLDFLLASFYLFSLPFISRVVTSFSFASFYFASFSVFIRFFSLGFFYFFSLYSFLFALLYCDFASAIG